VLALVVDRHGLDVEDIPAVRPATEIAELEVEVFRPLLCTPIPRATDPAG
jgi:hypothetical protein